MADEKSFNEKSFMSLIEGDKELFATLLDLFEKDWPQLIDKLLAAVESGDNKSIEQVGHRIKGNLRNFYAEDAAKIALSIEEAGRENAMQNLDPKVEELKEAIIDVQSDLRDFYKTL